MSALLPTLFPASNAPLCEHEAAYHHLQRMHAQSEQMLAAITSILIGLDESYLVTTWGQGAERAFDRPRSAVVGLPFAQSGIGWDWERIQKVLAECKATHRKTRVDDVVYVCPDGTEGLLGLTINPIHDHEETPIGFLILAADITERKQAETALRESEARYQRISANVPGMVYQFALHSDGSVNWPFVSEGCRELYGFGPEQLMDNPAETMDLTHPADRPGLDLAIAQSALSLAPFHWEGRIVLPSGEEKWIQASSRPERQLSGETLWDGLMMDITTRKKLEQQLAQAQKLESIGQLAAGIAHEINTPIQYIGDNIKFLGDSFRELSVLLHEYAVHDPAGAEKADLAYLLEEIPTALQQSLEGVERVAHIVRAMKEFSHPGGGEKTLIDLNHALESTIMVARNEWKYVADLVTEFDPDLPAVCCLPAEINQVFLNIIVNAAHAIKDVVGDGAGGKGTIRVKTRSDRSAVEVCISDTGTGMPDSVKSRIFDPFFTTKEVGRGTGQGLAISHTVVVEKHRGTISVESEMGQGTTFIIRIPRDEAIPVLAEAA